MSSELLQAGGENGKTSKFMSMKPSLHLFSYEMYSLVRSNVVWNNITMYKTLSKSISGIFGRNIKYRESNPYLEKNT